MHLSALQLSMLSPNQPSSLTAVAFVYRLKGDFEKVVEFANCSLRLRREDQFVVFESPIPKLKSSLDDLEPGSEVVKLEQNMILGPHVKQKREGSDDSAMTID